MQSLRKVTITRYITPLREGGSLPALAEGDDDFKYVLKFNGTGHGPKVLIAELLGGEIARAIGLKVPELVFADLHEAFGQTEADEEIQDLLKASKGLNLALHFLSGAINFDPVVKTIEAQLASQIVWLDAFITNVDRTFRNTNMLLWNRELWLIDHGACLYFHHGGTDWETASKTPFNTIRTHVLLPQASLLSKVDAEIKQILTPDKLTEIVNLIPNEWLVWSDSDKSPAELRDMYLNFFLTRLSNTDLFINEAQHARETLI
ncbi:MAG: aminotransferase class I and II [Bacteroidetes bacterium]|nr:aminotransferase class I and II [Bacteroidota bacterium]